MAACYTYYINRQMNLDIVVIEHMTADDEHIGISSIQSVHDFNSR